MGVFMGWGVGIDQYSLSNPAEPVSSTPAH